MESRVRPVLLAAGWAGAAALILVAPGNLVMRLVFGKFDDPSLVRQVLLAALGLMVALATGYYGLRTSNRPPDARPDGTLRPAPWVKAVTWAAAAVPLLGFSVPHMLWGLGVPFGVAETEAIKDASSGASVAFWGLLVAGPAAGGLLTLGLIWPWGQIVPSWIPFAGGRRVPRLLPVVPPAVVGILVGQYGAMMSGCLAFGFTRTCAPDGGTQALEGNWAFSGTYPVFLLWGGFLLAATAGYVHTTRASISPRRPNEPHVRPVDVSSGPSWRFSSPSGRA
ncbi:hypothetical protein [Actinopolymorpha pittospori]|uniref:Uncharacterized protein n=1 Tax=Actinopolymorpha pittospori TaxID=648752 RepID=A0A927MNH7_9ACTN|nr:hypothetical protein [Actinopolymorpha pittospori]MBE1603951.1 hypothetical protein [Actinopolymorpha pittospori]